MEQKLSRLYFIDAIRAWAILMMLQGHFVDGLLDPVFRDDSNIVYATWKYFRGITAPVFFTVSGFIFTLLLIKVPEKGWQNPRVLKGVKRGLQLLFIGYLLRLNLFGLLKGEVYGSFYLVDVLHCIGLSLLGIIGVYLLSTKKKPIIFPAILVSITVLLFLLEPMYKQWSFSFLPDMLANYLTKANGSVFTLIPWMGYTAFGAFLSVIFSRYRNMKQLYPASIAISLISGVALIYYSTGLFNLLFEATGIAVFQGLVNNNYLFIRLGNVMVVFAVFMTLRQFLTNKTLLRLGQNTLSIYVIHFVVLYGSFTGLGIYGFLHHGVAPSVVVPGAAIFMIVCSYLALKYDAQEEAIKGRISTALNGIREQAEPVLLFGYRQLRSTMNWIMRVIGFVKS
ncbi:heparan-alpha-glucosaminide N-acetyltransferase domain-containing protein [Zeaxanthinibacter sp. PT1]|uniref:acyltransferase family protein n=1 Tax=Zeaxanthinibacter TaxID=561554 RepID=UPI00234A95A2|nr:acyltransferase family protein [Zeaxanthinibacter sp. PT1]MDC6351389.1 heparan-alpha-glucosaminide N-acetyltransferase domain-containing protein [Zeaxanthinibacter sp. PT1]